MGKQGTLHVVHQNMQGLPSKILEAELFLNMFNVDVMCVTEHWILEFELLPYYDNYSIVSSYKRKNAIRGGSLIIVKNNLKCRERKDIVDLTVERTIELSCVELERHIIVSVYRPPDADFALYESTMEEVLLKIFTCNKALIVCGDFNIDIPNHPLSERLLNLFKCFNLNHLFVEPTRVTLTTSTCLDNVYCSSIPVNKSIIKHFISDHYGHSVTFPCNKIDEPEVFSYRPITESNIKKFQNNIELKMSFVPCLDDPDNLFTILSNLINKEFNDIFKLKTSKARVSVGFADWATPGIYKSRNSLYELYATRESRMQDPTFILLVKNYSKIFKKVCHAAKSLHLRNKIERSSNKIKATWNLINTETGKSKPHNKQITLNINDKVLTKKVEVANAFDSFFSNIPKIVTKSLNSTASGASDLLESSVAKCETEFSFRYVSADYIVKTFKSLNIKSTEDLWGISTKVLGTIIVDIAPCLAHVFNKCVDEGVFPDLMKHSKLIPLFKSGSEKDPANYRPISVLPALSKIFEKIILTQLLSHFNLNGLLHCNQFGFTKGRSTTDAGILLLKHVYDAFENSQDAIGVFCDLSKAFDCVSHATLISKLKHYGVQNRAIDLVQSYLSNRVQKVDVGGERSSGSTIDMGVPQGSILGPFLFLVYVNDLPAFVKDICDIVLFADDTSLVFKVDRSKANYDDVNASLSRVLNWFTVNNLLLNSKKTKCIKFTLPNVLNRPANIEINGEALTLVDSTTFLGLNIDARLQWGPHIEALAGRLSSAAYAVRTIRWLTDEATARLVYFSYFHSVMSYGILLWGKAADIQTIFILQKRAVRAIYKMKSRDSLRERFKEINILTVTSQYIYEILLYTHKHVSSFKKKGDVHSINTRNKNKLCIPKFRLEKVNRSFMGNTVRYYNKLPDNATKLPIRRFKAYIKKNLIKKAYYTVNDYINDRTAWPDIALPPVS